MEALSAGVGALITLGSMFGVAVIAERLFVTRREYEADQRAIKDKLDTIERLIVNGRAEKRPTN